MSKTMKRIIAATDFSDAATDAVDRAAQLASAHSAELCIVHALGGGEWTERVFLDLPAGYRDNIRQAAESTLVAECERLRGRGSPAVCESLLIDDLLHRSLPRLLAERPAELLVMGAHGAAHWTDLLLGSTADRVLRLHRLPVLLVRRPVLGEYVRIGVATDFSAASETAARFALRLLPSTTTLAVHISQPEFERSLAFAGLGTDRIEAYKRKRSSRAMSELDGFCQRIALAPGQVVPALREGHPERALAGLIDEAKLDLLVLGVTGRSELEVGLLGSISAHAAASASCDVLLVPVATAV
jgi:nucleotide-binding universal stress UspA family protein